MVGEDSQQGGISGRGGGGGMSGAGGPGAPPDSVSQGTLPLNDAIKGLKYKYVELQENHKKEMKKLEEKLEQYKTENHLQALTIQNLDKEREELKDDIRGFKEHHAAEKEKLYGELVAHRKKSEIAASEHARLEKTHARVAAERGQLAAVAKHAEDDVKKYREQVDELLHVNATLKVRVEELHKDVAILQSKVDDHDAAAAALDVQGYQKRIDELRQENAQLTTAAQQADTRTRQEEHLRARIAADCDELVRANVTLKAELDDARRRLRKELEVREHRSQKKQDKVREIEEAKEELGKIRDELAIMRIAQDNKDRKVADYKAQVQSMEHSLNTALETRNVLEERIEELESRTHAQETELIRLGQDKSLLIDDVAELRNTGEIKVMRLQQLVRENQDLKVQLDKFAREMAARREFDHLINEIEKSGEDYMHLIPPWPT
ncbi:hypothetical protein HK405_012083 [Cladochytrium tenue]|nr:hypothetical protein HK405_012083 [Cladochytrium tenue]